MRLGCIYILSMCEEIGGIVFVETTGRLLNVMAGLRF